MQPNDGDVNLWESPELKKKAWFDRRRRIIFINGMGNSGEDHRLSAEGLSTLQACPVIGVFNKTDGLWADLGQCLQDKATLGKSLNLPKIGMESEFDRWSAWCEAAYQAAHKTSPLLTKAAFVAKLIGSNAATLSLYLLLRSAELKDAAIFAHSQGNLIASNALTAVAIADGKGAIAGRLVHSFGSPCRFWPPGIDRRNSLFTFDPVGWLDYGFDFTSIKVGGVAAHAFEVYMRQDPDFTINRFRIGGWGATLNLDEAGLAAAIAEMGVNPDRVYGVFEKLCSSYWADRDDVALLYVEKLRAGSPQTLRTMVQAKPALADLLVKCLTGGMIGWDTKDEKSAASWVAGLKK